MRVTVKMEGLHEVLGGALARIEKGTTDGMREAATGLKEELREQVRSAGLGERMAKTWRSEVYPRSGTSLNPAAWVKSRAPKIVSFFEEGKPVRARNGRFLAIPTDDTPRKRGGRPMSVDEVQARYGKRLQLIPSSARFATPSMRRPGVAYLVLKDLVIRKSSQKWRNRSAREMARGRQSSTVIMFILVPIVKGQKRLDLRAAAETWAARVPGLIEKNMPE